VSGARRRSVTQLRSPSQAIAAGSRMVRTTVASSRTANASPTPSCFIEVCRSVAKVRKTKTMMIAALVMTPAERAMPSWIARAVVAPRSCASLMRETVKTW
jgi:hypothetical protein